MRKTTLSLLLLCGTAACVESPEALDTDPAAIIGGDQAEPWMHARAVRLSTGCTGTMISTVHVLTASHCLSFDTTPTVYAYPIVPLPDLGSPRASTSAVRPGVNPAWSDWVDDNGDFADVAVLTLASAFPQVTVANLAWELPVSGTAAVKVGQGAHDGADNPLHLLEFVDSFFVEENDDGGSFVTILDQTNPGDSGGPIYVTSTKRIAGTLFGDTYGGTANLHTSVPFHLDWILVQMGYTWPHGAVSGGQRRSGTVADSFPAATSRICQYACDRSGSACAAYNYNALGKTCTLLATPGTLVSALFYSTDAK